jgi:ankyrin repeat protein
MEEPKTEYIDTIENLFALSNLSDKKNSPLHIAAEMNSMYIYFLMANYRSYVTIKNIDGDTPLHILVRKNNFLCVKILIEQFDINPFEFNNMLQTPFDDAILANHMEIVMYYLTKYPIAKTLYHFAKGINSLTVSNNGEPFNENDVENFPKIRSNPPEFKFKFFKNLLYVEPIKHVKQYKMNVVKPKKVKKEKKFNISNNKKRNIDEENNDMEQVNQDDIKEENYEEDTDMQENINIEEKSIKLENIKIEE